MMRCQRGIAALEFALVLPLLILMFLGTAELARFLILQQKLDKVAYAMADFATQGSSVSQQDLNRFASAIPEIMKPLSAAAIPVVFTSVIYSDTSPAPCVNVVAPCVVWKYATSGGGISQTGAPGQTTQLPGGLATAFRQNYIVAEITYNYSPIIPLTGQLVNRLQPQVIYRYAVYKPRLGTLTQLN